MVSSTALSIIDKLIATGILVSEVKDLRKYVQELEEEVDRVHSLNNTMREAYAHSAATIDDLEKALAKCHKEIRELQELLIRRAEEE